MAELFRWGVGSIWRELWVISNWMLIQSCNTYFCFSPASVKTVARYIIWDMKTMYWCVTLNETNWFKTQVYNKTKDLHVCMTKRQSVYIYLRCDVDKNWSNANAIRANVSNLYYVTLSYHKNNTITKYIWLSRFYNTYWHRLEYTQGDSYRVALTTTHFQTQSCTNYVYNVHLL